MHTIHSGTTNVVVHMNASCSKIVHALLHVDGDCTLIVFTFLWLHAWDLPCDIITRFAVNFSPTGTLE